MVATDSEFGHSVKREKLRGGFISDQPQRFPVNTELFPGPWEALSCGRTLVCGCARGFPSKGGAGEGALTTDAPWPRSSLPHKMHSSQIFIHSPLLCVTNILTHTCTHSHARTHKHPHTCRHTRMHAHTLMRTLSHTNIHTHMHTRVHVHTHTCQDWDLSSV